MSRQVITADCVIASGGYATPEKRYRKGQVVDLSAAEITAIGSPGGAVRAATNADTLGEAATANTGT